MEEDRESVAGLTDVSRVMKAVTILKCVKKPFNKCWQLCKVVLNPQCRCRVNGHQLWNHLVVEMGVLHLLRQ